MNVEIDGGPSFECAPHDTILRAALRAGLSFPYGCNVGSCGNCRFQLLEGSVEHLRFDPPAWTDRDRVRGRWLACQAQPSGDVRIRVRLEPEPAPESPPEEMRGRLVQRLRVTHDISEFTFALSGPDGFAPGQYALLQLDGIPGARPYSMSNLPGDAHWRFHIKRVPGGRASEHLFDQLLPGATVGIDGPYGLAYLRSERPNDLLLVAGGSGLSPMLAIARAALTSTTHHDRRVWFFYGGRQPQDMCVEHILEDLTQSLRLAVTSAISIGAPEWDGPTGFIHDIVRTQVGDRLADFDVYFAGPPPMTDAMQVMLHEAGVPREQIWFDEFH